LVVTLIAIARAVELLLYRPHADRSDLRRRERNARSDAIAETQSQIGLAVADETPEVVGLDASTRLRRALTSQRILTPSLPRRAS
jgi:hypothetical protein